MTRIAIESAFEPIEVDFWGALFETRPMPRSKARQARKLNRKIQEMTLASNDPEPDPIELDGETLTDPDEIVEHLEDQIVVLYGELFDIRLVAAAGGRRKPSTLLRKKWEEDDLTAAGLASFLAKLGMAQRQQMMEDLESFADAAADRPT